MAVAFLNREHTIAAPGYSRWLIPPAAPLCPSLYRPGLCLQRLQPSDDQAYRHHSVGARRLEADRARLDFSLAIFFLGASAAVLGRWVEEGGPRRAMFTAALCWAGGFLVSAIGVYLHHLWIIYLGYGVIGGVGLGIGYISPVSTLIRWFPDRPGMATGMAIMGFGGGAFIAAPLAVWLMSQFPTPVHVGVAETLSSWV